MVGHSKSQIYILIHHLTTDVKEQGEGGVVKVPSCSKKWPDDRVSENTVHTFPSSIKSKSSPLCWYSHMDYSPESRAWLARTLVVMMCGERANVEVSGLGSSSNRQKEVKEDNREVELVRSWLSKKDRGEQCVMWMLAVSPSTLFKVRIAETKKTWWSIQWPELECQLYS